MGCCKLPGTEYGEENYDNDFGTVTKFNLSKNNKHNTSRIHNTNNTNNNTYNSNTPNNNNNNNYNDNINTNFDTIISVARGKNRNHNNTNKFNMGITDRTSDSEFENFNYNKSQDMLILTIIESKFNKPGTKLHITPKGLEESVVLNNNNVNSGSVYFGLENSETEIPNDFIFLPDEGICSQHFIIKYSKPFNSYNIKNLNSSGVFIRIEDKLILKESCIISFGTNHVMVQIRKEDNEESQETISYIRFKIVFGNNKGED